MAIFMKLQMIGIDYNSARVDVREHFSLTKSICAKTTIRIKQILSLRTQSNVGSVIISTCNRTEIWVSDSEEENLFEVFCKALDIDGTPYAQLFIARRSEEAVRYLFSLTCGINSQIFGEDQILTQVKTALTIAREAQTTSTVLEVLFRCAITSAKKIKSTVHLTAANTSAPARAVSLLEEKLGSLENLSCLVIGNGEMGRLTAKCLVAKKASVLMTLRQYKRQDVIIPMGTDIIQYDERYNILSEADIVISATVSPHYTLKLEKMPLATRPLTIVDLAVPRDIDPEIGQRDGITLYDMDSLVLSDKSRIIVDNEPLTQALEIIDEKYFEFEQWYYFRDNVEAVKKISRLTGRETVGKLKNPLKQIGGDSEIDVTNLQKDIERASAKAVSQLLFGLRENLAQEQWKPCLEAMLKIAKAKHKEGNTNVSSKST